MDDLQPLCPASAIATEGGSKMETCDHYGKALPAILTRDILGIARWQKFALQFCVGPTGFEPVSPP